MQVRCKKADDLIEKCTQKGAKERMAPKEEWLFSTFHHAGNGVGELFRWWFRGTREEMEDKGFRG